MKVLVIVYLALKVTSGTIINVSLHAKMDTMVISMKEFVLLVILLVKPVMLVLEVNKENVVLVIMILIVITDNTAALVTKSVDMKVLFVTVIRSNFLVLKTVLPVSKGNSFMEAPVSKIVHVDGMLMKTPLLVNYVATNVNVVSVNQITNVLNVMLELIYMKEVVCSLVPMVRMRIKLPKLVKNVMEVVKLVSDLKLMNVLPVRILIISI
jgi:hypothetical protein